MEGTGMAYQLRAHQLSTRVVAIVVLYLLLFQGNSTAQQINAWSDFTAMQYTFNPAVQPFGEWEEGNYMSLDAIYKHQWTGFKDAPQTACIGARYKLDKYNMTMGGFIANDQFGPTSSTQAQLQYAYQLQFDYDGEHTLAFGIGISATQFRLDGSKIVTQSPYDNLLAEEMHNTIVPNATFGVYYVNPVTRTRFRYKYLFAGLSVEQAVPLDVLFPGQGEFNGNLKRELHYNFTTGLRIYYSQSFDYVEPAIWAWYVINSPFHVIGGARMTFAEQQFWCGVYLSSAYEGSLQVGFRILEGIEIGYVGSVFPANTFSARPGMSHELRVGYRKWL